LIGREYAIFNLIKAAANNRLVTVSGLPGIGKTVICKNAAHFIA